MTVARSDYFTLHRRRSRTSTETPSSDISIFDNARSPRSDMTIPSPRSVSPIATPKRPRDVPRSVSSPKPLLPAIDFVPIDREQTRISLDTRVSSRPIFENPRPAPLPPKPTPRPKSLALDVIPEPPISSDSGSDVCEEAEDFLEFLSKAGFMAAGKRTTFHNTISESRRNSAIVSQSPIIRKTSASNSVNQLRRTSSSASCILHSRRTSFSMARQMSSGHFPLAPLPDTPPRLEHEAPWESPGINTIEPPSPPAMQREDHLSKVLSQMRMSSDFSLPSTLMLQNALEDSSGPFLARKISSNDFADLEMMLEKMGNPILRQLHQTYCQQFEKMAHQIAVLTRDLAELRQSKESASQLSREQPSSGSIPPYDRMISLDVVSPAPSRLSQRQISRQLSTPRLPGGSSHRAIERPGEPPFWKAQLQREREDWDYGGTSDGGESMGCVSPMTMF